MSGRSSALADLDPAALERLAAVLALALAAWWRQSSQLRQGIPGEDTLMGQDGR
ncbi:MAG: hypothetical protein M3Q71_04590 [Chloroflexota bacterium]|nr:hypothetical protein [Chloroflexota bacterium]